MVLVQSLASLRDFHARIARASSVGLGGAFGTDVSRLFIGIAARSQTHGAVVFEFNLRLALEDALREAVFKAIRSVIEVHNLRCVCFHVRGVAGHRSC